MYGFLLCPLVLSAQKQAITVKVMGGAGERLRVLPPVKGEFFMGSLTERQLDSTGATFFESSPGAWYFLYKKFYTLYVQPGREYELVINEKNAEQPIVIKAKDAKGQLALNEISKEFYQNVGMRLYREDSVFEHTFPKVVMMLEEKQHLFRQLYAKGEIDKSMLEYALDNAASYYASVGGALLMKPANTTELDKTQPGYNAAAANKIGAQWRQLLTIADVNNRKLATSMEFFQYAKQFNTWYVGFFLAKQAGTYKRPANIDESARREGEAIRQYYREPMKEYQLAGWMGGLLVENQYQSFIPAACSTFAKNYPNSPFNTLLRNGADVVAAYHNKAGKGFEAGQQFVKNYDQLTSFQDLAATFAGKTVYVDLWATWCGPCKEEFAHNKALKEVLKKNKVGALYVSIDRKEEEPRWKEMIKFYDLEGHHLRASEALMKDIRTVFGANGTLYIPRYAILKNGKLVVATAKPPSDLPGLEAQLQKVAAMP